MDHAGQPVDEPGRSAEQVATRAPMHPFKEAIHPPKEQQGDKRHRAKHPGSDFLSAENALYGDRYALAGVRRRKIA